jgi:hypothetical protein
MAKILKIVPTVVKATLGGSFLTGVVEVTMEVRCGFLWTDKKVVVRDYASTTGILWQNVITGAYDHKLSDRITQFGDTLLENIPYEIKEVTL